MTHTAINQALIGRLESAQMLLDNALPKVEQHWLWSSPNEHILCIGVQLAHMSGNLRQYLIVNLTQEEDLRERPSEFEIRPKVKLAELAGRLTSDLDKAKTLIQAAPSRVWSEVYHVQTFSMTRLEACIHAIEHLNYHIGQIALLIKYYSPQDLSFYPNIT